VDNLLELFMPTLTRLGLGEYEKYNKKKKEKAAAAAAAAASADGKPAAASADGKPAAAAAPGVVVPEVVPVGISLDPSGTEDLEVLDK
jgi:hypothetical protein